MKAELYETLLALRRLEDELGTTLLRRERDGVTLTSASKGFLHLGWPANTKDSVSPASSASSVWHYRRDFIDAR